MSNVDNTILAGADPWVASSLLQKAIRRSDERLSSVAARTLFRFRGKGVWRRLVNIAFEDVGIADPQLLLELASAATDDRMREAAGDERELLVEFCFRLASAPKDRSADYLLTASLKGSSHYAERTYVRTLDLNSKIDLLMGEKEPLLTKAIALLSLLTIKGEGERILPPSQFKSILGLIPKPSFESSIFDATVLASMLRAHPVVLMPVLLALELDQKNTSIQSYPLVQAEFANGIPLYSYDQYTSLGKRAITRFSRECEELRESLQRCQLDEVIASSVAHMAVFYAEGFAVERQFRWSMSDELETLGRRADLTSLGAKAADIRHIVESVRRNLGTLDDIRRRLLLNKRRKS